MNQGDDPKEGLAALLADILTEGAPDPALMARFADDPSALSPEERKRIEQRLAESPEVRDQLAVLKRFDFLETRETSSSESRSWLPNALAWIRRLFEARPILAWAPAIAVSALALPLIYQSMFPTSHLNRSSEPARELVSRGLAGEQIADETPGIPAAELLPKDELLPVAERLPAAEPLPTARLFASNARVVTTPEYLAPQGARPLLRSARLGLADTPHPPRLIIALAPKHVGQTASEAPSLYWYLSEIPEAGVFEFWIDAADAGSVPGQSKGAPEGEVSDASIRKDLPSPNQPGLQRIHLSDYGVDLKAGIEYSWTVSLGLDAYASGWIKRVEPPPLVVKRLAEESLGEAPAIYAEAGFWYDALSSLLELVSDHPNNESLRTARLELLRQGGLEKIGEALAVR